MTSVFDGISELQKNKLFKILETHIYKFNKNEEIVTTLNNEKVVCVLLSGYAHILNMNYNGEEYLMEELNPNDVFGTHMSNINASEYEVRAIEESTVLVINYNVLINSKNITHSYFNIFILNLLDILNNKMQKTNERIQILTKKSIREKLLAFFEIEYKKNHSKFIYLSGNFKELADYLSTNRSAMFRELKYLKEEKFIKIEGKKIILLYTPMV